MTDGQLRGTCGASDWGVLRRFRMRGMVMTSAFEDLKWALLKDYLASTRRGSGSQSTDRSAVNVGLHVDKNAGETSSLIIIDPAASSVRHPQISHLLSNPQIRASCESCFLCKLLIGKKDEPPRNRTENPQIKSSTGRCPLDAALSFRLGNLKICCPPDAA